MLIVLRVQGLGEYVDGMAVQPILFAAAIVQAEEQQHWKKSKRIKRK
jgi:hypothetical protein